MQSNLAAAVLLAILCSDVCLCRRVSSSANRRYKKPSTTAAATKLPPTTTASPVQGNLCRGGGMIDGVGLEPNDYNFYRAHLKHFPDGLHYPNCSMPLQPNMTRETLVEECVNFTIASSKLSLPKRQDASNPKERVMWLVINHLCANESCALPCPFALKFKGPPFH
ncbi:hypothetical protein JRQ81_011039 [Phrynocephalus forsythii]|uniref:Prion/Doppel protein beta-ribbon domain-containing protein n=1 Tax=Phrynocephalus forsythii TaxID=171643 RepID=A0A9Q1AQY6_9SAUR|nr:hypothetical protein JRQ81_011039 [Phrynocephalus forsythii]